jgi:[acyl-carrier-protein] S-malonyltransferase
VTGESGRIAFVFPGQGSQEVGMGAALAAAFPAARAVFEAADDALGFGLSDLCFHGPDDTLRETINAQPAIATVSLAALAALRQALGFDGVAGAPWPAFVAGHSVGEYSAIVAAGGIELADGLRLVRERGRLMHREGTSCPGGMAAVLGMPAEPIAAFCARATREVADDPAVVALRARHSGAGQVVIANDNAPGQIVISGERTALERAMELAREAGAKRVVPLTVSGAFHSPVMAPAAPDLQSALDAATVRDLAAPLVANSTAQPISAANDIRAELAAQIAAPVRWTASIEWLVSGGGVTAFVEIGQGQVLAGLIKRIAKGVTILSAGTPDEIAATAAALRAARFGA